MNEDKQVSESAESTAETSSEVKDVAETLFGEKTESDSQTSETQASDTTEEETKAEGEEEKKEGEEEEKKASEEEDKPITIDDLKEIKLPEGFELDMESPFTKEFLDLLNNPPDREEVPQKLLDLYARMGEANVKQWLDLQKEWTQEIRNDPVIGGDNLDPALRKVDNLIHEYASFHKDKAAEIDSSLRGAFDLTGAGNNPHVIKFLHWIATQQSEGAPLTGDSTGGERSRAERMFGT